MATPPDDLLWCKSLEKTISPAEGRRAGSTGRALRRLTIGVRPREVLAVVGPHGAGKTVFLDCASGLLPVDAGEIWFAGNAVHRMTERERTSLRASRFGYVGSDPDLLPDLTVAENVVLPLLPGRRRRAAEAIALSWLARLEVEDLAQVRADRVPAGTGQRVALARALARYPDVLFADEPTERIPAPHADRLLRLMLNATRSHGGAVVLATRLPEVAARADRRVAIDQGRIAPRGSSGSTRSGTRKAPPC